jgi:hypothetical protein
MVAPCSSGVRVCCIGAAPFLNAVLTHTLISSLPHSLTPTLAQGEASRIWRGKDTRTQDAWLMNLHQVLPEEENWMWHLATHPVLLNIIAAHLG